MGAPARRYPVNDNRASQAPDYARVARYLSDAELEDEILQGLGEPDYKVALLAEAERRAQNGGPGGDDD